MWLIERVDATSGRSVPLCAHESKSLVAHYAVRLEKLRRAILSTQNIELPREERIDPAHYWAFDNPTFLEDVTFKAVEVPTLGRAWTRQEEKDHEF